MREIWTYIDRRNERIFHKSLRALHKARGLANLLSATTRAVAIGDGDGCLDADRTAADCVAHGADRVTISSLPNGFGVRADAIAAGLAALVREENPGLVLFALSDQGREVAALAARELSAGLIADAESFAVEDGRVYAWCPAWSGEAEAEIYFADPDRTGFITVGPRPSGVPRQAGSPGEVEQVALESVVVPAGLTLVSSEPLPAEHNRLEDAEVVVVGGAGLGNADGFGRARELAAALGAEVGATRPAVLAHWASEDHLIGQTGKTVRPGLLLSLGTSGAVQYTASIAGSGAIVAVNRDPGAPIFDLADVGVVDDCRAFVPALIEKIKQASLRRLADVLCESALTGERLGFGAMVRSMRESRSWSTTDLANAAGHDPDLIEQVESGEITPSVSFLLRLAKAFDVDPNTFLTPEEKSAIADQRTQAFVTRTSNYSYETLTPGGENQRLRAFMITIEAKSDHKPVAYKHEGEEFVYVIEGELELTVAGTAHRLKPTESRHFNSDVPHKLKSLSDVDTRCLVILYTP